jgi:hypothetical protein
MSAGTEIIRRRETVAAKAAPENQPGPPMAELMVPISPGKLIDKITILEIKSQCADRTYKRPDVGSGTGRGELQSGGRWQVAGHDPG